VTREESVSFVIRQAFACVEGYDAIVSSGKHTREEIALAAIADIHDELGRCFNAIRAAARPEESTSTPAEAEQLLLIAYSQLCYVAMVACSTAMAMPNLERVPKPVGEVAH